MYGINTGGPDQIPWSAITATYTKGKPVDYGGNVWDVVTTISQGIVEMLEEVVNSTKIIQENEIPSYADRRGPFYSTSRYKWSEFMFVYPIGSLSLLSEESLFPSIYLFLQVLVLSVTRPYYKCPDSQYYSANDRTRNATCRDDT